MEHFQCHETWTAQSVALVTVHNYIRITEPTTIKPLRKRNGFPQFHHPTCSVLAFCQHTSIGTVDLLLIFTCCWTWSGWLISPFLKAFFKGCFDFGATKRVHQTSRRSLRKPPRPKAGSWIITLKRPSMQCWSTHHSSNLSRILSLTSNGIPDFSTSVSRFTSYHFLEGQVQVCEVAVRTQMTLVISSYYSLKKWSYFVAGNLHQILSLARLATSVE